LGLSGQVADPRRSCKFSGGRGSRGGAEVGGGGPGIKEEGRVEEVTEYI